MNTNRWRRVALGAIVISLLLVAPEVLHAVAKTGAPALNIGLSARHRAMASAGVADMWDPANVYSNPAAVNGMQESGFLSAMREDLAPALVDDVWFGTIHSGVSKGFGRGLALGLSISVSRLSYGESILTNPEGTPLGTFDSHEDIFAIAGGIGGGLGESLHWAFGTAVKRWSADYTPVNLTGTADPIEPSGWMADVGATLWNTMAASDWRVTPAVGVAAVNLGPDIDISEDDDDPLPSWLNAGVSVRVDGPEVTFGNNQLRAISFTVDADNQHGLNDQGTWWSFGCELAMMDMAFLRLGRRTDDQVRRADSHWGLAIGAPIGPVRARLEYANIEDHGISRDATGFTLVWLFESERDG